MSVLIKSIRSATEEEWDFIWKNCDYSTYFHSREWAEIWQAYTNNRIRPEPKIIVFNDGKKALLPLSCKRILNGIIKIYLSSPAVTFGGWISNNDLTKEHAVVMNEYLTKQLKNLLFRINPYCDTPGKLDIKTDQDDLTHTLNLKEDFNAVYKRWTKGHRSAVTKARKAGVIIRLASSQEDWKTYFSIYQNSLKRWGNQASSKYSWKFFNEMYQRKSSKIKLWIAIYHNQVISGAVCFYSKKHVAYWHGAALEDFFNIRPVNLLLYECIKNACENGFTWFDFNPSGGHEGVKNFKKSFGSIALDCPIVITSMLSVKFFKKVQSLLSLITVLKK